MRVVGQEVRGRYVQVREVAAATPGDAYLFPDAVVMLEDDDFASPLPGCESAEEAGSAGAKDENIGIVE